MPDKIELRNQVLSEVFKRFSQKYGLKGTVDFDANIVKSIKELITDMKTYGINDIEQVRYMEGLALAIAGSGISTARLMTLTKLSKRVLEHGKWMRRGLHEVTRKAKTGKEDKAVNEGNENEEVIQDSDNNTIFLTMKMLKKIGTSA